MIKLLNVTRETAGGTSMLYLSYAPRQKVSRTLTVAEDGSIAIDLDAEGNVLGIELIGAGTADFAKLVKIAEERHLSLDGLFSYA